MELLETKMALLIDHISRYFENTQDSASGPHIHIQQL